MNKYGTLYICPTPIGNLEDITLRSLRILKEVDLIACEDTRITCKLLNRYEIKTPTTSYHKFSESKKCGQLINLLKEGKNIALVSDAGTPLISDPGNVLVKAAADNGIKIEPLPGACAFTTLLSGVYLENPNFVFLGFLPKTKSEKENLLLKYKDTNIIIYEAPSRLVKTFEEIKCALGSVKVITGRELTKIHEEIKRGNIENLIEHFSANPPKGELCIIIEGISDNVNIEEKELIEKIEILKKEGYTSKEISKILSLLTGLTKNDIYKLTVR